MLIDANVWRESTPESSSDQSRFLSSPLPCLFAGGRETGTATGQHGPASVIDRQLRPVFTPTVGLIKTQYYDRSRLSHSFDVSDETALSGRRSVLLLIQSKKVRSFKKVKENAFC